jgi:cytochrome P450
MNDHFSFLPEGNAAAVHFYSLHRDPRYFTLPNNFLPDRWLTAEERRSIDSVLQPSDNFIHNAAASIPFSFGPSNCVGKKLAWMEMRMSVCELMHRFDMRFPEGWNPAEYEETLCDHFVLSKGELPIILSPRKSS